jgi:hypothetical protein
MRTSHSYIVLDLEIAQGYIIAKMGKRDGRGLSTALGTCVNGRCDDPRISSIAYHIL